MIGTPLSNLFNDNRIKAATSHVFIACADINNPHFEALFDINFEIPKNYQNYVQGVAVFPDGYTPFIIHPEEKCCAFQPNNEVISKNDPDGAFTDFDGDSKMSAILGKTSLFPEDSTERLEYAPFWCNSKTLRAENMINCRLPSSGELMVMLKYRSEINLAFEKIGGTPLNNTYWSSHEMTKDYMFGVSITSYGKPKTQTSRSYALSYYARPVASLSKFKII